VQRIAGAPQWTLAAKLRANPAAWYGMLLAHLGVAVFIVGVTLVKGYEVERDVRLDVGQAVEVGGYTFKFRGVAPQTGPNYRALVGTIDVERDGKVLDSLRPEKRIYAASGQAMTEAAIDAGVFGDRYVSLGEPVTDDTINGAWGVRIYVKPFIDWIWAGCFLMALGGFVAVSDRRYRIAAREKLAAWMRDARAA
jgi:cytochrome c-type biogenesis protein CcmF